MAKKKKTALKEAKILLIAFIYFSLVLEENKKDGEEILTTKMKNIFHPLAKVTSMYRHLFEETKKTMDEIITEWGKKENIDFLLLSVTIVSTYYEAFSGKKRSFTPLKIEHIVDIQDECIEMIHGEIKNKNEANNMIENTFLFSEFLVNYILNKGK